MCIWVGNLTLNCVTKTPKYAVYKSPFPLGQITRQGWQDKAIPPKSAHCTSCISTLLDPSLGSLCKAQRDEELFLL